MRSSRRATAWAARAPRSGRRRHRWAPALRRRGGGDDDDEDDDEEEEEEEDEEDDDAHLFDDEMMKAPSPTRILKATRSRREQKKPGPRRRP